MPISYTIMTKEMTDKQKKDFDYTPRVTEAIKKELNDRHEVGVPRTGLIGECMWDSLSPAKVLDNPTEELLKAMELVGKYGDWLYLYLNEIEEDKYQKNNKIIK